MDFCELKPRIYTYLGFRGVERSDCVDALIVESLNELSEKAQFGYVYKAFDKFPEFLNKPPYIEFLRGCDSVILAIMTLGAGIDRLVKYKSRVDMTAAMVSDASASALLEYLSDEYEKKLGEARTYRFCPGYGGSSIADLPYIFELVDARGIGVTLSPDNYMFPSKSMAGVIGLGGGKPIKSCADCMLEERCVYKKEGGTCYAKNQATIKP